MDEKSTMVGNIVLVRTYSAGVHVGRMQARDGREVVLSDARRIWSWVGANTLSEIAVSGLSRGSRVSEQVPTILVLEAIEIIPVSALAAQRIDDCGGGE